MDLVLPDVAASLRLVAGFFLFMLPIMMIAAVAVVAARRARSRDAERD